MGAPEGAKSKAPLKLGDVQGDRISSWLDRRGEAFCVFNLKISRRKKMIVWAPVSPRGAQDSGLPVKLSFSKTVSPGVLGQ